MRFWLSVVPVGLIRRVPLDYKKGKYLLRKEDLLFCHTNSSKLVGKNAIFNLDGEYSFSNHLTRLRVNSLVVSSRWIWYILTVYWKEGKFGKECKHWVNQSTLSQGKLVEYPIPIPSIFEQTEIVRRVEALFKIADQIEERYTKARTYVDKLTQSILAKAFRGELVPQDPNDEPTSELLKRIKEEKTKTETKAKSRRQGRPSKR